MKYQIGDEVMCHPEHKSNAYYFMGVQTITAIDESATYCYRVNNAYWYSEDQLVPYSVKVAGVGKDAPTVIGASGGKQSQVLYDFTLADPKAMFEMTKVLHEGALKYGRNNWRLIPIEEHLNHMIIHAYAYLAGDTSDEHLSHIMCRALFAQGVAVQTEEDKANAMG